MKKSLSVLLGPIGIIAVTILISSVSITLAKNSTPKNTRTVYLNKKDPKNYPYKNNYLRVLRTNKGGRYIVKD